MGCSSQAPLWLDATYTNGYAGVLFWSANGGDSASNYNGTKSMLKTWAQTHARDVNITEEIALHQQPTAPTSPHQSAPPAP